MCENADMSLYLDLNPKEKSNAHLISAHIEYGLSLAQIISDPFSEVPECGIFGEER